MIVPSKIQLTQEGTKDEQAEDRWMGATMTAALGYDDHDWQPELDADDSCDRCGDDLVVDECRRCDYAWSEA